MCERPCTRLAHGGGRGASGKSPEHRSAAVLQPTRSQLKERVVDLAPDDLFPSTKRTLQLDDDGEDDGEDDGAGRADDGEGGEPST